MTVFKINPEDEIITMDSTVVYVCGSIKKEGLDILKEAVKVHSISICVHSQTLSNCVFHNLNGNGTPGSISQLTRQ